MLSQPILVVEDENALCSLIRQLLQRAGHQVISARTAAEALHVLGQPSSPIHVVVLEWSLGDDGSGEQLARYLSQTRPSIRLILMNGLLPKCRQPEQWPPNWLFLEKPFLPGELCRVVREAMQRGALSPFRADASAGRAARNSARCG